MKDIVLRTLILGAASAAASLGATPAAAAGSSHSQPTTVVVAPQGATAASRPVCTTVRPTGSRFTRRTCRTQAEHDAERQAQQDAARDFQKEGFTYPRDDAFDVNQALGDSRGMAPQ